MQTGQRLLALWGMLLNLFLATALGQAEERRFYIGTYSGANSRGIYTATFNTETGEIKGITLAAETKHPSFLAIHPTGKFLYAVGEIDDFQGHKTGAVNSYEVNVENGSLRFLNQQSSEGAAPCHLVLDNNGKHVLVANYTGGSVAVLPVFESGRLAKASSAIQHKGKSVDKSRQEAPHAHSINLDAANQYAVVADLGLDQVLVYKFDSKNGKLTLNDPPFTATRPGSGPRHFSFHPSGKYAYVINEMALTINAFAYDAEKGKLETLQEIPTVPNPIKGHSTAEVLVHPSGKFVYGSNRGHDSLSIFQVDEATGKLTAAGNQSTLGQTPRNFAFDPSGNYLLAENQGSNTIVVFKIDLKTGALKPVGEPVSVPSPVCIRFVPAVAK